MTSLNSKNDDSTDIVDTSNFNVENFSFCSKSVILRYKKPLYVIDDIFHFKMELEAFPEIQANNIYLECELMHSPLVAIPISEQEENDYEMVNTYIIKNIKQQFFF